MSIPQLKYKRGDTAVDKLEEAMEYLKETGELKDSQIKVLEDDLNWLMDEHSEIVRDEKKEVIRKGLKNLHEDNKGKTAYSVVKTLKREFLPGVRALYD
jgi:hypothetical protein